MKGKSTLTRVLEIGGIVSAIVLVAFGIAAIVMGIDGRSTVQSNLSNEYVVGTPDMTPDGIAPGVAEVKAAQAEIGAARQQAGVEPIEFTPVVAPECSVADEPVDDGTSARCFAEYLRIHALESTNGLVYSQMGRFLAKDDAPPAETDFNGATSNEEYALIDDRTGQPVSNGVRNLWVTETALASALNLAYTAEQISLFGVVVGVALLLAGVGFAILAVAALHRRSSTRAQD
jgi:hypothetical protein